MSLILTIAIVLLAVAVRLLMPPVPAAMTWASRRWGRRSTLVLCGVGIVCGAAAIYVSRH